MEFIKENANRGHVPEPCGEVRRDLALLELAQLQKDDIAAGTQRGAGELAVPHLWRDSGPIPDNPRER